MTECEIRALFARCVAALNYRALRLEVRERPLALLLCVESFGRGQEWGTLDVRAWRSILCENDDKSIWRLAELHRLLKVFVQKGWLVVDAAAGTYRLRPDQWPCWAEVSALIGRHDRSRLNFVPDADLNSMLAWLSQQAAMGRPLTSILSPEGGEEAGPRSANFSQGTAKVSQEDANNSQSRKLFYDFPPKPVPPAPPPKPSVEPVFSSGFVEKFGSSSPVGLSRSSTVLDPNRTPNPEHSSRPSRDAFRVDGASRVGHLAVRPPLENGPSATLCTNDGYIAEKLARHPKGERLRRELVAQQTWTAKAFQRHFEINPARAREDLGWFLEATNPNARMNTHMGSVSLQTK